MFTQCTWRAPENVSYQLIKRFTQFQRAIQLGKKYPHYSPSSQPFPVSTPSFLDGFDIFYIQHYLMVGRYYFVIDFFSNQYFDFLFRSEKRSVSCGKVHNLLESEKLKIWIIQTIMIMISGHVDGDVFTLAT